MRPTSLSRVIRRRSAADALKGDALLIDAGLVPSGVVKAVLSGGGVANGAWVHGSTGAVRGGHGWRGHSSGACVRV